MERHHYDVRLRTDQVDLTLQLRPVDTGADAVEAEEGELDAADVPDLVETEAGHTDPVLCQQDLGLVGAGRTEIRQVVVGEVGDVDPGKVEPGDGARVATELEATVDDRTVFDQRRLAADIEEVARLELDRGIAPGVEAGGVEHGLVVDLA